MGRSPMAAERRTRPNTARTVGFFLENPLTQDGVNYVVGYIDEFLQKSRGHMVILFGV